MKIFKIEKNDSEQRLDKFLKKILVNASSSLIYKLNRKNKIKVKSAQNDGFKNQDNEYRLQEGDEIKIFLLDEEFDLLTKKQQQKVIEKSNKFDKANIVYEDGDLLVVNKDFGINVHPGDHKTSEVSLIYQIQDYLGEKLNSLTFKPSLVHRIDRDTSGILIIAKKKDILTKLVEDFKNHKNLRKIYYTIVFGKMPEKSGTINKKLKRIIDAKNEDKVQISPDGQEAITKYSVIGEKQIQTNSGKIDISILEVEILTGRMHQIRVHLSSLGNHILGDNKYGDKQLNGYLSKNFGLVRQALHSWKVEFFHSGKNKKMFLEAKIKKDLVDFLEKI